MFDFERDFKIPLDPSKKASSNYLRIVASNKYEKSTVPDSVACFGGGKSDPPRTVKLVAASAGSSKALEAGAAAAKASVGTAQAGAVVAKASAGAASEASAGETPDRALETVSAEEDANGVVKAAEADVVQDAQVAGAEKAAECAGVAESDESAEPAEAARTAEAGESEELAEPAESAEPAGLAEAGEPEEAEGSAEAGASAKPAEPVEVGKSSEPEAITAFEGERSESDAETVADISADDKAEAASSDAAASDDAVAAADPVASECDSASSAEISTNAPEGNPTSVDADTSASKVASGTEGSAGATDPSAR